MNVFNHKTLISANYSPIKPMFMKNKKNSSIISIDLYLNIYKHIDMFD